MALRTTEIQRNIITMFSRAEIWTKSMLLYGKNAVKCVRKQPAFPCELIYHTQTKYYSKQYRNSTIRTWKKKFDLMIFLIFYEFFKSLHFQNLINDANLDKIVIFSEKRCITHLLLYISTI